MLDSGFSIYIYVWDNNEITIEKMLKKEFSYAGYTGYTIKQLERNWFKVTVGLYIKAGSGYEKEDVEGITHFLEHLHFRRSGSMSQEELYYKMECIGSDLRGLTYCDFLEYSMKILPVNIKECLDIFEKIINAGECTDEPEGPENPELMVPQVFHRRKPESVRCIIGNLENSDSLC